MSTVRKPLFSATDLDEPIRGELFGVERLEKLAEDLGIEDRVYSERRRGRPLLPRLSRNGRALLEAYRSIAGAIREERAISPAAEWLVDNFHIVEEQLREIREDLPRGFYRELPKLAAGPLEGYPRVYGLAWAFIEHTDSHFDADTLRRFVAAYQRIQPLTIGELWAIAISLRLVLVENLRRLADRIVKRRRAREEADALADTILETKTLAEDAVRARLALAEAQPLSTAFAVQLVQRLRDRDPAETAAVAWLNERLAREGVTPEEAVRREHQQQVAMHVSVRNVITSMRLLSSADWKEFFESVSLVHEALCNGTRVAEMDFATRDRYRRAVEELSRGSGTPELEVARKAVAQAASNRESTESRMADPGYYLISKGRAEFERRLGFRVPPRRWLRRAWVAAAVRGYLGAIFLLTLFLLALPLAIAAAHGGTAVELLLMGLLAAIPASELANTIVQRDVTERVGPLRLPKLELKDGVPEGLRTLVSVPALLTSADEIRKLLERIEIHYLSNADGDLRFALLSDWKDAAQESIPEDEELLAAAVAGIRDLNRRHGPAPDGGARFFLSHRRRVWNPSEGKWIGWERKRGKLRELNRLLRGARDTTFLSVGGDPPQGVRYVITLDADTRLPRGAACRLVGALAHPLNLPVFDPLSGRVVKGHAILQPRVTPTLPAIGEGSLFARTFSGPAGTDPYAFAVSDVYQDLFGQGIYTGKGIYDVDAFEEALDDRVPENALLSHDLFEGIFARAGLATDIELFEDYPSHYEAAAARQHRWARGDWQLLPWLLPRVPVGAPGFGVPPAHENRRAANPIPAIGRWQILDNLRRTLLAPTAFLCLVAAWMGAGVAPLVWTAFILAAIALPRFFPVIAGLLPRRRGIAKRSFLLGLGSELTVAASQTALSIVLLAHQAWLMGDAILRTLWRLFVTRRRLLEWTTAEHARQEVGLEREGFYRRMWGAAAAAGAAALFALFGRPESLPLELAFVGLWALSPAIARAISLPPSATPEETLKPEDSSLFRLIARRTWRFFEKFAGEEDNNLPPDNFQEDPRPAVAYRTSPTNVGLYLLSTIAARDLGWIGSTETAERLEAALAAMNRLERFRGHFFNWYDTRTLLPLEPKYVSTVDSGNLAAALIVTRQACLELSEDPSSSRSQAVAGIGDAAALARQAVEGLPGNRGAGAASRRELDQALAGIETRLALDSAAGSWPELLSELGVLAETLADTAEALAQEEGALFEEVVAWAAAVKAGIGSHARDHTPPSQEELPRRFAALARAAQGFHQTMDFEFLYDPARHLFSIGYRLTDGRLDPGYYDLLASEARLASFIAIARGDVAPAHWFRLGRALTPAAKGSALVSWSGSMFEYLMPDLVMEVPTGSLLDQTARHVVSRQIQYGQERNVPWGVSESAYHTRDLHLTYQYSNFGISGLGLKRGLSEDLVVAPYATALAAMIDPGAAARNFRKLASAEALGSYGFYEALDYTRERLPEGKRVMVVKAYMAHHQGMTVVALANVLTGSRMRRRFHKEPIVQATELLLQERTPRGVAVARPRAEEVGTQLHVRDFVPPVLRQFQSPHDPTPRTHLLSNGRYTVMLTAAGSGYSRWRDLAVTRWREDATRDPWGTFVFLRDLKSGMVWSAGYQPSGKESDSYDVAYYEDRAEIHRRDGSIATTLEVVVSPEDDAEVRQVSVTNLSTRSREIELTSYAEIVLNTPAADDAHPVFSNLFVQTEFAPGLEALLATRRPRQAAEPRVWAAHLAVVEGFAHGGAQYETDRARFLGRGHDVRNASSIQDGRPLSNTAGAVLDPIFSLRRRVRLPPGTTARVTFSTIAASTREQLLAVADKYRQPAAFERTATLAWTQAQVQLRHLNIGADEAHLYQRLATRILYSDPTMRAGQEVLRRNAGGPSLLWGHGISGDTPIVLVRIDDVEDREIVRQVLHAQEYWRMKGLAVDLVVVNEQASSYAPELQANLEALIRAAQASLAHGEHAPHGGVFLLTGDQLSSEARDALFSVARVVLLSRHGSLADQIVRLLKAKPAPQPPRAKAPEQPPEEVPPPRPVLEFFNGLGGFSENGKEYVTVLGQGQWTPAPWLNVIANESFGFQVSESGSSATWSQNSRENKLTPWSNDPVSDPTGETLYVRDEETGEIWGPTALPIREEWPYLARHGQGYSRFEHESHGIALELLQFVPLQDPLKISRLSIENRSGRPRALSVTAFVEWVLGASRAAAAPLVVTWTDESTGAIFARNPWNEPFPGRVAFADLSGQQSAWTADRTEFLGRNGAVDRPAALAWGEVLSGKVGAGMDPCAALQTFLELLPQGRAEVVFFLGEAGSSGEAQRLLRRYRKENLDARLADVSRYWDDVLGALQVQTPDRSMNLILNRWLLYQTLSCRVWARSAFYQSGGAYGFRDQLQDVMALTVARREIAREHLLRAAARQFREGDVQHWWHPPSGTGVRTRISDDRLWLPYSVTHYLQVTGDQAVLDEEIPFLEGEALEPEQHEFYFEPRVSKQNGSLYEHCARALDFSLAVGRHGLPLMGTGDWNDGMNRVGYRGEGESVWLAWFLHTNLWEFAKLAETRGESERAKRWREQVVALKEAVEREGWDGDWYRRAFFDDGTPLGSVSSVECRIDSIAQSWGVISGAAEPSRQTRAMAAVEEYLVRRGDGLVLLFTPPFDKSPLDPGYIKGYLPGVRENGGQYTHAALWSLIAFAALEQGDKAGELFSILNPINHTSTRAGVHRYKVEPYVAAADIYAERPHVGRGGWTWYTGSAGWMYRAGIEWILGFRLRGAVLHLDPCIPRAWPGFQMTFRYHSSRYQLTVENPYGVTRGITRIRLDGRPLEAGKREIPLADDGALHTIDVLMGTVSSSGIES